MSDPSRIRRQQLLREAEGCLELVTLFGDQWVLPSPTRDTLARRAIETLKQIETPGGLKGQILFLQGQALRQMQRFAEAIPPLRESAEYEPQNVHIRLALAWCYKRCRRLDLAIEALESALEADPALAILHYNLACYWSLAGNPKVAISYLAQALDLEPDYREMVHQETDFDPIRHHPHFLALTEVIV
jgi:tetratricopeptide (TPR) repeat protein